MGSKNVSIIINNFNYERYVGDAIESALAQSSAASEVIVVDDGSTDQSRLVIESFGDRVVPIFKENGGQASCFNAGFAMSHGEIVVFLDADDVLLPSAVEALRELFGTDVVQAHWPLWIIDANGDRTGALKPDRLLPEGSLRDQLAQGGPRSFTNAPTSGNAWCRTYLERVMPIPTSSYRICADAYLYTLSPVFGDVRRSLTPQGCWRFHGENNYNGSREPLQERVRTERDRYDLLASTLCDTLARAGTAASTAMWQERNGSYRRMDRILSATAQVEKAVPEGSTIVLVDDGDWSDVFWAGDEIVAGRRVVRPFDGRLPLGREPLTDEDVIAEVDRLRDAGAGYVVFAWPGTWWLRHFGGLQHHLETRYRHVATAGTMLMIFDLTWARETVSSSRAAELAGEIDALENDIKRIRHEIRRREVVSEVRRLARGTLPSGARVAVVSRGDEALVRLPDLDAWHFPQTEDGRYAGSYPATDADATAQLESLRAKGAEYLVFPSTAFWWLDHYLGFRFHLESSYRKLTESEDCVIFSLGTG